MSACPVPKQISPKCLQKVNLNDLYNVVKLVYAFILSSRYHDFFYFFKA